MAGSAAERGFLTVLKIITWIVYVLAFAATIILAFGFVLAMLGASPTAPFSAFIFKWSLRFMGPFAGMIPSTPLANGGAIVWNGLVAIFAYMVVAWIVGLALSAVSRRLNVERAAVSQPRTPQQPTASAAPAQPAVAAQPAQPAAPARPVAPAQPAAPAEPAPSVPTQPGAPDA